MMVKAATQIHLATDYKTIRRLCPPLISNQKTSTQGKHQHGSAHVKSEYIYTQNLHLHVCLEHSRKLHCRR